MDDQDQINFAIVGAGLMGRWHAAAATYGGGRCMAVVDPNLAAAEKLADQYGGAAPCAELAAMLEQKQPDVVHICTPTATHALLVEQALQAGCHVLVEKPLAVSLAETERLVALAERQGRLLCPIHQFAFQSGASRALAEVGRSGQIVQLNGRFHTAGGQGQPPERLDEIAIEILPHPLSLINHFLPQGLSQKNAWSVQRAGAGELWAITAQDEMTMTIDISLAGRPTVAEFEIIGQAGAWHLDLYHGYAFFENGAVSRRRKVVRPFTAALSRLRAATTNLAARAWHRETAYPGLRRLISHFYRALPAGPAPITAAEIITVAAIQEHLEKHFLP